MKPSHTLSRLTQRPSEMDYLQLLVPPDVSKAKEQKDDTFTAIISSVSPSAARVWRSLPSPLRVVAVAAVGSIAYVLYRALRYVSSALYSALDLSIDDYSHPLFKNVLSHLGITPADPVLPPSTVVVRAEDTYSAPDLERVIETQGAESAPTSTVSGTTTAPVEPQAKRTVLSRMSDRLRGVHAGVSAGSYTDAEKQILNVLVDAKVNLRGGQGLTPEHRALITRVAEEEGVPADHMLAMAQMESGGNPYAISSTGAVGLFQFTGRTARGYGLANRFDPEANTRAAARLYKDNAAYLAKRGVTPTLDSVYLLHQLGPRAVTLLRASEKDSDVTDAVLLDAMSKNYGISSARTYTELNKKKIARAYSTAQSTAAASGAYDVASLPVVPRVLQTEVARNEVKPKTTPPQPQSVASRSQTQAPTPATSYPESSIFMRALNGLLLQVPIH